MEGLGGDQGHLAHAFGGAVADAGKEAEVPEKVQGLQYLGGSPGGGPVFAVAGKAQLLAVGAEAQVPGLKVVTGYHEGRRRRPGP